MPHAQLSEPRLIDAAFGILILDEIEEMDEGEEPIIQHHFHRPSHHQQSTYREPRLEKFSGDSSQTFATWFEDFRSTIQGMEMDDKQKVNAMKRNLDKQARQNFEGFAPKQVATLTAAAKAMTILYDLKTSHEWQQRFRQINKT